MCGFKGYRFMGYLIYFIQGTMLTSLAVIMPILKQQLGLTYESTGMIFSMGMFGYFLGSMLTGIMLEKSGSKLPSFIGFILIPLGMTGIILSGNSISLALSNFVSNLGTAALQIALPSIAKNYTNRTGKMLNLFHSLCALGAVSSPLILGIIMNYGISWKYFYLSTALGTLIPFMIMLRIKLAENVNHTDAVPGNSFGFLKKPLFWFFCAAVTLYVFTESGINSWSPMFAHDYLNFEETLSGLLPSLFWFGLFLGRFISSVFVDKVGKSKWLLMVTLIGMPIVFLSQKPYPNFIFIAVSVFLAGLIHSSIYPTLQSLLIDRIQKGLGYALSVFAAFGGLGGMISGLAVGSLSNSLGIENGYFSLFFFFIALFSVVVLVFLKEVNESKNNKV